MLLTVLLSAVFIALDQWFKWLAASYLLPVGHADLIPGFIELFYIENTGAAFSLFEGQQTFLIVVTGIALLVVAYILLFRRPKPKLEYLALLFIFSGGVGNLIDRISHGYVVDYLNFQFINFPVFNLADILVCVGFGLLLLSVIYSEFIAPKKNKAKGPDADDDADEKPPAPDDADKVEGEQGVG